MTKMFPFFDKLILKNYNPTGLYYQLLPKNPTSIEGRRYRSLLKVKVLRFENSLRANHPDSDFCLQEQLMIQYVVWKFLMQNLC